VLILNNLVNDYLLVFSSQPLSSALPGSQGSNFFKLLFCLAEKGCHFPHVLFYCSFNILVALLLNEIFPFMLADPIQGQRRSSVSHRAMRTALDLSEQELLGERFE
jgi:hypothetical protein